MRSPEATRVQNCPPSPLAGIPESSGFLGRESGSRRGDSNPGPLHPAAKLAAVPYDLRHSFCSLLLYEGRTAIELARQAGHAPSMDLDTYQHVIDELDSTERVPAEERIRRARRPIAEPDEPVRDPPGWCRCGRRAENRLDNGSRRPDSNRGPLHYEAVLQGKRPIMSDQP